MIQFICSTCSKTYEVQFTANRLIYLNGNRRVELKKENQDCEPCEQEIEKEATEAREAARKRVRERKHHE